MTQTEEQETPTTAMIVPGLGLAIDLARAEPLLLAEAVDELAAMRSEMTEAEAVLRKELVTRLDRTGKWTQRYRHGDVEYEVKAPSPDAGTTSYDAQALEERLREHVAARDLDPEAADAALERTVTLTLKVPIGLDTTPEKLADALQGAEEITIAGHPVQLHEVSWARKVKQAGMNALAKIPAAKDTVEAVTVSLPPTDRKATVKRKQKER